MKVKKQIAEKEKGFVLDPEAIFWRIDKIFSNSFPIIAVLAFFYIAYHIELLLPAIGMSILAYIANQLLKERRP